MDELTGIIMANALMRPTGMDYVVMQCCINAHDRTYGELKNRA